MIYEIIITINEHVLGIKSENYSLILSIKIYFMMIIGLQILNILVGKIKSDYYWVERRKTYKRFSNYRRENQIRSK
jgi:hypothetical protein